MRIEGLRPAVCLFHQLRQLRLKLGELLLDIAKFFRRCSRLCLGLRRRRLRRRGGGPCSAGERFEERFLLLLKRLEAWSGEMFHHFGWALSHHVKPHAEDLRNHTLGLVGIAAHQLGQDIDGQHVFASTLVFGDDLQQVLARDIIAALEVDDLDVAPISNEPGDIVEGDVVAGLGVVEPAARVAFDQQWLSVTGHLRPPFTNGVVVPERLARPLIELALAFAMWMGCRVELKRLSTRVNRTEDYFAAFEDFFAVAVTSSVAFLTMAVASSATFLTAAVASSVAVLLVVSMTSSMPA